MERPPLLLTGSAHPDLARNVANLLEVPCEVAVEKSYPDGEVYPLLPVSVRGEGEHIYIIQPICPPDVNRAFVELLFITSAAKRSSADKITNVIPYVGYARGDRQNDKRTTIPVSDVLQSLEERGAFRFMVVDIHQEASLGAVRIATDHLHASNVLVPKMKEIIEERNLSNIVIAAPDQGGTKLLEAYARLLRAMGVDVRGTAYTPQYRDPRTNKKSLLGVTGDVNSANVFIIDDIFATGNSTRQSAAKFMEEGASSVRTVMAHGLFLNTIEDDNPPLSALELLRESPIQEVITTNTTKLREDILEASDLITVVNIGPLLAASIYCVHNGISLTNELNERLQIYLEKENRNNGSKKNIPISNLQALT